jgi:hypothetical protein
MANLSVLANHLGKWRGTNKLWLDGPGEPEESAGVLEVTGDQVRISWAFRGSAHQGLCVLEDTEDTVQLDWQDSWHAENGMQFTGEAFADAVDVFGSYPAGEGPDWGWRIVIDLGEPDRLLLRMYNITPEGEEALAVELDGRR